MTQQLQFPNGRKIFVQNRPAFSGLGCTGLRGLDGLSGVLPQNFMPLVGLGVIRLPQVQSLVGLGVLPAAAIPVAKKITDTVTSMYHQDNIFIGHRDEVLKLLATQYDFNKEPFVSLWPQYKLAHADIPDRKLATYAPEFARLHEFVRALLNKTRAGWGDAFYNKSWEIAAGMQASDPSRSYKGAPGPALQWAYANPMATGQYTQQAATSTSLIDQYLPQGAQILTQGQNSIMTASAGGGTPPPPEVKAGFTTENLMIMGGIALGTAALAYGAHVMSKKKKAA